MKNPTIFSKEIPSRSFKVRTSIGSLLICIVPFLSCIYVGAEAYSLFNISKAIGYIVVAAWLATELALIRYLYVSKDIPRYVYECFQLNLIFSNMWFLCVGIAGFISNA